MINQVIYDVIITVDDLQDSLLSIESAREYDMTILEDNLFELLQVKIEY